MKRDVVKVVFSIMFLVIMISGVLAVETGTCDIVARGDCEENDETGYIVMGVSGLTNAHGEYPDQGTYGAVLCCNFGDGWQEDECSEGNEMISLSAETNAHAEEPELTSYSIPVCYEDLSCASTQYETCPENFPIEMLSLSSTTGTNSHIGQFEDYTVKVCCASETALQANCNIESAVWSFNEASEGQNVPIIVYGSLGCQDIAVNVDVWEVEYTQIGFVKIRNDVGTLTEEGIDGNFQENPDTGEIFALTEWTAGLSEEGSNEYYLVASLSRNENEIFTSEEPDLFVTEWDETDCANKLTCEDYTSELECESDETLCDVVGNMEIPNVDCSDDAIVCDCFWDDDLETCGFSYLEIEDCGTPDEGCNYGCTLCSNDDGDYCNLGAICPTGEYPVCNEDGVCDEGEGCLCPDDCPDGEKDSCMDGTFCFSEKCYTYDIQDLGTFGSCKISQTVESNCDEDPVGKKIISWIGTWDGEDEEGREDCEQETRITVSCPAQVQLPFFDYVELMISFLVVILVYLVFHFRIRKHSGKNKKKKK